MTAETNLRRFPRPSVAVDIAVLTALPSRLAGSGSLAVLVQGQDDSSTRRALPGRFLREGQTVSECVQDVLRIKADLLEVSVKPRLLTVFDAPDRDPRGWTLSLAHSLTLRPQRLQDARGELVGVTPRGKLASGESLMFDHDEIVQEAAAAIRERYERSPDPDELLEDMFTMAQLRSVHETVLGEPLLKDTFRRRMEPDLQPVDKQEGVPLVRSGGGRPAQVFTRIPSIDPSPAAQRRLLLPRPKG